MYTVLIVEDDPMVAMINTRYVLSCGGFSVSGHCRDGLSCIEFLKKEPVDLIILDVYMPGLDGFETLRRLREEQISVDAIMVTAANDREALENAMHLGVVDYLVKPFAYDRFKMALDKFISQRETLKTELALDQQSIDNIFGSAPKKEILLPKGIQENTLNTLIGCLKLYPNSWLTGDEIASLTGLTGVTVRRYMNYLVEQGVVSNEMNYDTGGRPGLRYSLNSK